MRPSRLRDDLELVVGGKISSLAENRILTGR
jgi:hypothetical protein